jgi:integrase
VCDRGDGRPIDPDFFTKTFKRLALQAGLHPRTRLHDLRHGVATQLARAGVHAHTVSTVMGHSSVTFTLDVYTEVGRGSHAGSVGARGGAEPVTSAKTRRAPPEDGASTRAGGA